MGNSSSCCGYSSTISDNNHTKDSTNRNRNTNITSANLRKDHLLPRVNTPTTVSDLQHISERGPDDGDPDPSQDPTATTIFMERSKVKPVNAQNGTGSGALTRKKSQHQISTAADGKLKKSSSCSTIYLDDSTVSQPNLKNTVKCASLAIYYHIKNGGDGGRKLDIFDERLHPVPRGTTPGEEAPEPPEPEHRHIYKFVRTLFNATQLTAECAIITLVYLERLLVCAELDICPSNWKRIVLGAILLASKVWDDQAVWNVDYCQVLKDIDIEDMNELERQFLELLQFNINVSSSVYVKYYFDLRTLAEAHDLAFPAEPLSKDRAQKLEAMSRVMEDKLTAELVKNDMKKWSSLDNVNNVPGGGPRRSVAILS